MSLISFVLLILLSALSFVATIAWATLFTRLASGFLHSIKLSETEKSTTTRQVSAVVPMRNEAANVDQCITSLLGDSSISRIIVVDDSSSDGTQDAVNRYCSNERVQLVSISEPKEGWSGKSYACYTGALRADSDWILFIDADTFISSDAVSRSLNLVIANRLDAVTCFGGLRCRGTWDKIAVPFYFSLLNSFIRFGGNKEGRGSYFIGSFILIKKEKYFGFGGHVAVASELVEDKALSDIATKNGLKIQMVYAPKRITTEWAPGFKNGTGALLREILPQMQPHLSASVALAAALSLQFALPVLSVILSFGAGTSFQDALVILGSLSIGFEILITAYAGKIMQLKRRYCCFYSFFFILPEIIFLAILWISVYKIYTRPAINWRGRLYQYRRAKVVVRRAKEDALASEGLREHDSLNSKTPNLKLLIERLNLRVKAFPVPKFENHVSSFHIEDSLHFVEY